jgi:hypothetical protein
MNTSKIMNNSQLNNSNLNLSQLSVEKIQEFMYFIYFNPLNVATF